MNKKLIIVGILTILLLIGCQKELKEESSEDVVTEEEHSMDDLVVDPGFDFSMMQTVEVKIVNKKMTYEYFDIYTANPKNGGSAIITNAYFDKDGEYNYSIKIATAYTSIYIQSKNADMQSKSVNIVNKVAYYSYE
jgi:hypothetical protein